MTKTLTFAVLPAETLKEVAVMADSMDDILHPGMHRDPQFPDAPPGWSPDEARRVAEAENIELDDDHWEIVKALQRIFRNDADAGIRAIHDAFEEHFHSRGGMRHVYRILPGGPVAQGCRLAGLKAPAGSTNASFGSVQ